MIKKTAKAQFWPDAHPPLFPTESTAQRTGVFENYLSLLLLVPRSRPRFTEDFADKDEDENGTSRGLVAFGPGCLHR